MAKTASFSDIVAFPQSNKHVCCASVYFYHQWDLNILLFIATLIYANSINPKWLTLFKCLELL